jgi:HK97 family phage major capsid protein
MPEGTALLNNEDREQVKGILLEFKEQYSKLREQVAKHGAAESATLEKIDKLDKGMAEMQGKYDAAAKRADELEIKLNEKPRERVPMQSLGEIVIADAGLLAHIKSGSRNGYTVSVPRGLYGAKDITGVSRAVPESLPGIAPGPRLALGVRTLVPQGTTTAGAITYVVETSFTNNANVVAEGTAKPKSDKVFTPTTQPVETIAHFFKVSRQSYEDLPGLAAQIESNGIYGVQLKEDQQLLNGSGVAPQLKGFMTVAAAAPGAGTGATLVDAVGAAIFDLASKGYMADGTVLNPADWGGVAMLKNLQGNYIFANPLAYNSTLSIWGTRLVLSSQMAAGNFLTGAFRGNSLILDREEVNVRVAEQNVDDFEKNMLTILVEERLALLIFTAAAFEKGTTPALAGGETEASARRR